MNDGRRRFGALYMATFLHSSEHAPVTQRINSSTPEKRRRIEAAALALFTTQGFHGTNNREIAKRAGVSTAAIYTHFASKEALFAALLAERRAGVGSWLRQVVGALEEPLSQHQLASFAAAICARMREDPDYFMLIFIDVVEFNNRHIRASFHDVPTWFRLVVGPLLDRVREQPGWRGQDPAFVLATIYMYFVHYGLIEQHMGGHRHLGVAEEVAIKGVVELFSAGLWQMPAAAATSDGSADAVARRKLLDEAAEDRIDVVRRLSNRLWAWPPEIPAERSPREVDRSVARIPLISLPEIARQRPDDTQLRIEAAALDLFTTQGFHGANIRDIADKAGVSQGTIYTYYASKETLFAELAATYRGCQAAFTHHLLMTLDEPFSRDGLRQLAKATRSLVYDDGQYWLLLFIDVLEFGNRHFADMYHDMPERFRRSARPAFEKTRQQPGWCGLDPAFALAVIYLLFFAYFIVERYMHGNRHLGVPEDEAVERLIDLLSGGFFRP
jgi:AcrR family transcriptional regulator